MSIPPIEPRRAMPTPTERRRAGEVVRPDDLDFFRSTIAVVRDGASLSREVAGRMMSLLIHGSVPEEDVAAYLAALADKGESVEEIVASARVLLDAAVPFPCTLDALDTCGTGGDGSRTFNVSTLAALVVASAGQPVVKHGNRSSSGGVGSADLLEALSVPTQLEPGRSAEMMHRLGFAFLFAPLYHPGARRVAPVRRRLGRRTIFNLLGPLCNPARPAYQVLGVPAFHLAHKMAEALRRLGTRRAFVVSGPGSVDELLPAEGNRVIEVAASRLVLCEMSHVDAGLTPSTVENLGGGDATRNAVIAHDVLHGQRGAPRDAVVMNAGLALLAAGRVSSLAEGCAACEATIDRGDASRLLDDLRHFPSTEGAAP